MVATLLAWLQERPLPPGARDGSPPPEDKTYLPSLTVSLCSHCLDAAPAATGRPVSCVQRPVASRAPAVRQAGGGGAPSPGPGKGHGQGLSTSRRGATEPASAP